MDNNTAKLRGLKNQDGEKELNFDSKSKSKMIKRVGVLEKVLTGLVSTVNNMAKVDFPVWHSELVTEDDDVTFLTHVRRFKLNAELFGWNDRVMALNFIFTLRGDIREYIDTLEDSTRLSFKELTKDLKQIYTTNKNIKGKMLELRNICWDPETMSINEVAALVKSKMKLLGVNLDQSDNELWLKDAFMTAVREGDPVFAGWVELNKPDDCSFSQLQDFMNSKLETFRIESTSTEVEPDREVDY